MLSTKSRLLTRLPGARNRISMDFAGSLPAAGQTRGRSSSDTKQRTCSSWSDVKGSVIRSDGWTERRGPQRRERTLRNGDLVGGNRKPAFGDVKQTLRGALVALGIVQHALRHTVRIQAWRRKAVHLHGQRQDAGHTLAVQHKGIGRQPGYSVRTDVAKIAVEKSLYAGIGRAQAASRAVDPFDSSCAAAGRRSPAGPTRPCSGSAVGPAPRV